MFSRTYSRILRIKYYRNVTVFLPSIIQVLIFFCLVAESGVFGVRLDSLIERDRSFLEESPLETKVPLVFYKVSGIPGIKSKYYFSVFFLQIITDQEGWSIYQAESNKIICTI